MTTATPLPKHPRDPAGHPAAGLNRDLLHLVAAGASPAGTPVTTPARGSEHGDQRVLDALGVALYTTDEQGRITYFNEAAATFWGRRPELGEEWCGSLQLFWPDGAPMAHDECPMALAIKQGVPMHGREAIAERPDGSRVAFVAYPTPITDGAGAVVGAVNVLVDVTERSEVEARLRLAAQELESSNSVKDEFLGLVSHELRTPVTTILGNARLLQDRRDTLADATRSAMLSDIAAEAERLHEIIENLLSLTKLGAGTTPDLEPVVLDRVVRGSVAHVANVHPDHPIEVTTRPTVIVDAERTYLELLVENLLGNAVKYSPDRSPIEVLVEDVGDEVRVRVLDRGIGFDRDAASALFEPFYRSDAARTTAGGVGIGLAVCRRIVDVLGGRMWALPRDGGGAEFGFGLPIAATGDEPPLRPL